MSKNVTIFYADDDHDDLDFFKDAVGELGKGVEVITHDRGDKLLYALQNPPPSPQIIFLDLNMPGKTGFDVLQELKSNEELKEIPVVIFSTSNDDQSVAKSMKMGANFYVSKSTCFDTFKRSIEFALSINWKTFTPSLSNFIYR